MHGDRVFEERDLSFPIGEGCEFGICTGLEQALEKFKKGEKSRIEIKSKYAFGTAGNTELQIPPDADIVYVAEMKTFDRVNINILLLLIIIHAVMAIKYFLSFTIYHLSSFIIYHDNVMVMIYCMFFVDEGKLGYGLFREA